MCNTKFYTHDIYRNEGYLTRVQLAILDHNAHTERSVAVNRKGNTIYHRKYRKQTKKWDVTAVKSTKEYKYIPDLMQQIFEERMMSAAPLKQPITLAQDHPAKRQRTIAHTQPDETVNIATNKSSRF